MAKGLPFDLDDFREQFTPLEDPQSQINQLHPFESVLIICVMGVLVGATGPISIVMWSMAKAEWLKSLIDLPNYLP